MRFTLVTFNVGLLDFLRGLFQPVPFVEQRLNALPDALRSMEADIIALQELYRETHRRSLASAINDVYPFFAQTQKPARFGLDNSLMTLSKVAMDSDLELFRCALPDEMLLDSKGILASRLRVGAKTEVLVLNIHTTAGGSLSHPESKRTDAVRAKQIARVLSRANRETDAVVIIAGDLNAGPRVSEDNYRLFQTGGFDSVYDCLHPSSAEPTWDPANSLNRSGPHRTSPPQRVDHVFVRHEDVASGRIRLFESTIQSKEEVVAVPGQQGQRVTLSDHYSVRVVLDIDEK